MAGPLLCCAPAEVVELLPGALAGNYLLAPVPDARTAELLRRTDAPPSTAAVLICTSGSTGRPKQVLLPAAALRAAADAFRVSRGGFTWWCALPVHHVAGLMVLVRGLFDRDHGGLGVRFVTSDLAGLRPDGGVNAISIVPTQLVRVLRDAERTAALASFDLVLVGGAGMPAGLLDRARAAGIAVVTSYGMSETCGGCVFDGRPLPGVALALAADGRISIAADQLFSGYRGDPGLTAARLRDGRLYTSDRGEWDEHGRLRILGRLDEVVITGGENVDLAEVQRVVDDLVPGLAAVYPVADAEWGVRIVLATPDDRYDLAWWRGRLGSRLPAAALPRQLVKLAGLPRTAAGKLDRVRLGELLAAGGPTDARGPD